MHVRNPVEWGVDQVRLTGSALGRMMDHRHKRPFRKLAAYRCPISGMPWRAASTISARSAATSYSWRSSIRWSAWCWPG